MKQVSVDVYWASENAAQDVLVLLVNKNFPFNPEGIVMEEEYSFEEGIRALENVNCNSDESVNFIITGKSKDRVYFSLKKWGRRKLVKVAFSFLADSFQNVDFIRQYLAIKELLCCFVYDTLDERWQSEESIREYEFAGVDHSSLKKKKDVAGRMVIDTSSNFGRSIHSIGLKFVAGGEMFFGQVFFNIIPHDLIILKCQKFDYIDNNGEMVLHVVLYNLFEDNIAKIREAQKDFLLSTNMFSIAERLHTNYIGLAVAVGSLGL
jgi:hypothetical protein